MKSLAGNEELDGIESEQIQSKKCIRIHKPDKLKVKSVLESVNYLESNLTALNQLLMEDEITCYCLGSSSNFKLDNRKSPGRHPLNHVGE